MFFRNGTYDRANCSDDVNHGLLVTGYKDKEYFILKNSWGLDW